MKISQTEEQTLLSQSISRYLADRYDDAARRRAEAQACGYDRDTWTEIAELGWLGASVGESAGGFGGPREMAIVLEGAGRAMMAEPLVTACLALSILEAADPSHGSLPGLLSGNSMACGLAAQAGSGLSVTGRNGSRVLSGRFPTVHAGAAADLLVLALPDIAVALDPAARGIDMRAFRGMDGRRYADIVFRDVPLDDGSVLCEGETARPVADRASQVFSVATAAEASGIAARLFEETLAYVAQREQFGQPIGRFQALQHRLADMYVAVEEARSLALAAARSAEDDEAPGRAVSQAVVGTVDRALHVAKEAIQLHGGVGMTEDLPLGAGLRRIKVLQLMPGGAEDHRKRLTT
ncbi:hypothetical protein CSC94_16950 [Zhengella mangrovi]|uniref:Acyl-CoA dehydrogenase n=1 Tax=Zhengella mangrovi TaxID=1982044 RepID=A0A2G1QJR3_9HYPH|nr:acyl-CoA dehydrogenase family protein [Zhengella mangrovi]PHP65777.1 hypothetical protein CSC94_16950 [Zhengella mangrovi]